MNIALDVMMLLQGHVHLGSNHEHISCSHGLGSQDRK